MIPNPKTSYRANRKKQAENRLKISYITKQHPGLQAYILAQHNINSLHVCNTIAKLIVTYIFSLLFSISPKSNVTLAKGTSAAPKAS